MPLDLETFAPTRGFTAEELSKYGVRVEGDTVEIPILGRGGTWYSRVHRPDGCPKYEGPKGMASHLFNPLGLGPGTDEVWIAEGEFDTLSLVVVGIPALGVLGAGNFNRTELEKALTGKVASARTQIFELSEGVSGSASTRDLETMLQLVYLRMTSAHKDEQAFQAYVSRVRGFLENQEASPNYQFAREFQKRFTSDHPRRRFLQPADLDGIDADRALAIYAERFADASDFIFTIVGN